MKSYIKPFTVLLLTLAIGLGIGWFASSFYYKNRVKQLTRLTKQEGFIRHHFEMLQINETQQQQIKPILQKYYTRLELHRASIRKELDSMRTEIKPYLTEEQIKALQHMRRHRGKRGKPDEAPPSGQNAVLE